MILYPDSTNRSEAWYTKSLSGTYALTKLFWPVSSLIMRPNATKSSIASFAASLITWPMPFMMAQISRKYSTNISIVSTFLSLKVSHFYWDSQGSCHLSAYLGARQKCGHSLHRSAAISLRVFISLDAETQIFRKAELQQYRYSDCQTIKYSDVISFRDL